MGPAEAYLIAEIAALLKARTPGTPLVLPRWVDSAALAAAYRMAGLTTRRQRFLEAQHARRIASIKRQAGNRKKPQVRQSGAVVGKP